MEIKSEYQIAFSAANRGLEVSSEGLHPSAVDRVGSLWLLNGGEPLKSLTYSSPIASTDSGERLPANPTATHARHSEMSGGERRGQAGTARAIALLWARSSILAQFNDDSLLSWLAPVHIVANGSPGKEQGTLPRRTL